MNIPSDDMYRDALNYSLENFAETIFGYAESMSAVDTYQFGDYNKYYCKSFDAEKKKKSRDERFPQDCRKAYEMGKAFAGAGGIC
jgi:hypothetical protein